MFETIVNTLIKHCARIDYIPDSGAGSSYRLLIAGGTRHNTAPNDKLLFSVGYRPSFFCCGAGEAGGWAYSKLLESSANDELFNIFNLFLTHNALSRPFTQATLNSDQKAVEKALLENGWKAISSFKNWQYGASGKTITVLGYARDREWFPDQFWTNTNQFRNVSARPYAGY